MGTTIEVVDTEIAEQQQQQPFDAFAILLDDYQTGLPGKAWRTRLLSKSAKNGDPLEGVAVRFAVTAGEGSLSTTTAMTDAYGQATEYTDAWRRARYKHRRGKRRRSFPDGGL